MVDKNERSVQWLVACGDEVARLTNPIWEKEYIGPEKEQVEKEKVKLFEPLGRL